MEICINAEQLRAALRDIEAAEANGFDYCLTVFRIVSAGPTLGHIRFRYSDLIERASETDPKLDWGRFQGITRNNRFVGGALVPVASPALHALKNAERKLQVATDMAKMADEVLAHARAELERARRAVPPMKEG